MPVKIDHEKCCWKDGQCVSCGCGSACVGCVEACPSGALKRSKSLEYFLENCTDCGLCIQACKHSALSLI